MERKLEEICQGEEFVIQLQEIYYCNLKMNTNKIKCDYRSKSADHNGLYRCDAAMSKYGDVIKH